MKHQLYLSTSLVLFGVVLIVTAFGEILTFAGAIIGIDYRYKR